VRRCVRAEEGVHKLEAAPRAGHQRERAVGRIFISTSLRPMATTLKRALISSGPRTNPWFQEKQPAQDPVRRAGRTSTRTWSAALVITADFSRTFLCGDVPATERAKRISTGSLMSRFIRNMEKRGAPGTTFQEFHREGRGRFPRPYRARRYFCACTWRWHDGASIRTSCIERTTRPRVTTAVIEPGMTLLHRELYRTRGRWAKA